MNLNIFKYEFKKITTSGIFKLFTLVSIFINYKSSIELREVYTLRSFNMLEGLVHTLNNKNLITWILIPFSLYFMTKIFFDDQLDYQVKVKSRNKLNWFSQKVLSLISYISIMILILTVTSLFINLFMLNFKFGWSHTVVNSIPGIPEITPLELQSLDAQIFPFQPYYHPLEVIVISIFFLISGLSLLGLIISLFSLLTRKPLVGMVAAFIYYIFSTKYMFFVEKRFSFLKYFTIDSYILFANHNFDNMSSNLFTVRESIFGLALLSFSFFLIGLFIIKKKDI